MPTAQSKVFTVYGMMPEEIAYGGARFSRSNKTFADNVATITREKSISFFNNNYHGYGHGSIADMAHGALVFENISILAALAVEDQGLWDGMECSTRYIDFSRPNYYVPAQLELEDRSAYVEAVDALFAAYGELLPRVHDYVREVVGESDEFSRGQKNQVRARAFDLLRGLLPAAAQTHVFQITSGRALEAQIKRLREAARPELTELAAKMQTAALEAPPWTPTGEAGESLFPTIVKYTDPSPYPAGFAARLTDVAARCGWLGAIEGSPTRAHVGRAAEVTLHEVGLADVPAGLLYAQLPGDWRTARRRAAELGAEVWHNLLMEGRGAFDRWPRALRQAPLLFDIVLDLGAFRDLHRHRRTTQLIKPFDPLGYNVPATLAEIGVDGAYAAAIERALGLAIKLNRRYPGSRPGDYALPLASRIRFGLMMDLDEADYVIRQRSAIKGHFAYREAAVRMAEALAGLLSAQPWAAGLVIEYTPYGGELEGILER